MKLTGKQRKELAVIKYFIPSWVKFDPIVDQDVEAFLAWSDRGVKYHIKPLANNGLAALHYGKQYRDLQITSWKHSIEEGILSKREILSGLPDDIVPRIEKAIGGATLGKPMFEAIDGEMVFAGYEIPEAVDFRHRFGSAILK